MSQDLRDHSEHQKEFARLVKENFGEPIQDFATRQIYQFSDYIDLRQKYLGVLQLLANACAFIPEASEDGRDIIECIQDAFEDSKTVLPGVKYKKHGNFITINFIAAP